MNKLERYLHCVRYLYRHREEPDNRSKRRRLQRDRTLSHWHMKRLLERLKTGG